MGRVLLADKRDEDILGILRSADRQKFTKYTKTEVTAIMPKILKARRNGWSLVKQELEIGVCGISAAVRNASGSAIGAVSISFNMARFDQQRAIDHFLPILLNVISSMSAPALSAAGIHQQADIIQRRA
jgi:DNA-binding IclR family transcriptional regulator